VKLLAAKVPGHQLPQTFRDKSWLGLAQGDALIYARVLTFRQLDSIESLKGLPVLLLQFCMGRFKPISVDIEDFQTKLLSISAHSLTGY
jgi:hypothetical protein